MTRPLHLLAVAALFVGACGEQVLVPATSSTTGSTGSAAVTTGAGGDGAIEP